MALEAAEWSRIQDVFHALADCTPAEQLDELERLATDEPEIAREVRSMLFADASGASLLDRALGDIAGDVLESPEELPRQRFGPYRLVRFLGEGGMGVVYLGHRDDLDAQAAIKILAHAWLSPARRDRFRSETRVLAALDHPAIARLFDADHLPNGTPWFAMEYVEGEPITTWVWKRGLGIRAVLALFSQVCDAVRHAHERAVIHRDIKPSNILVTESGAIKLLDFGIAKRSRDPGSDTRSRTVVRLMTPQYAAPEQLEGKVVGVTADVYALGVVLHELIAGLRPYRLDDAGVDDAATIRAAYPPNIRRAIQRRSALESSFTPASAITVGALAASEWADLDALLATALAPNPAERYRSVEAFQADITRFLANQPLAAHPATWRYRARKFLRRRWRQVALAAAVLGAAGVGLFLHTRALAAARDVAIAEAARTTRLRQFLIDLFQGGRDEAAPAESLRVADVVRNGIREAHGLTDDPVTQVELLGTLGIISEQLGSFPRADTLFQQAIEKSETVNGANHPETMRVRIRHAALLSSAGQADSAERRLLALEPLVLAHAPPNHPVIAEFDQTLGKLLAERGKIAEAVGRLERAVTQRARTDSTSREYAEALRELGNAAFYAGDARRADSLFRVALPINRRLFGPRHPNVGYLLTNLGILASATGNLDAAERDLAEGIAISAAWFGEHHWLTAGARVPLGQTLVRQKKFAEAVPLLRGTIEDLSREPLVPRSSVNLARNALGNALLGLGDRAGARVEFERSARELREDLGPSHMNTMLVEASLASILAESGAPDSAITILRDLVARGGTAYGDGHREVATFRIKLGHALLRADRPREAIEATTAGLRAFDSTVTAPHETRRIARADLAAAYTAIGDTAMAAQYRP